MLFNKISVILITLYNVNIKTFFFKIFWEHRSTNIRVHLINHCIMKHIITISHNLSKVLGCYWQNYKVIDLNNQPKAHDFEYSNSTYLKTNSHWWIKFSLTRQTCPKHKTLLKLSPRLKVSIYFLSFIFCSTWRRPLDTRLSILIKLHASTSHYGTAPIRSLNTFILW